MNFISDNAYGAAPEILAALARVNSGTASGYGTDKASKHVTEQLCELFEREVAAFPVATGTAANSLTLATLTPHYGAIFCHEGAHIYSDECGAPEFFSGGAKLVPLAAQHGKLTPEVLRQALSNFYRGDVHQVQPMTISITQATERGTVYTPGEVGAIGEFAKAERLLLHMDGARFANAIASLGCKPADITWRAGVDAMSFGLTKNGAVAAECVVFFDRARLADFEFRRKRGGHLFSKMRFFSAQIEAMLEDGLWLRLASHANSMAQQLSRELAKLPGFSLEDPTEANEIFVRLPNQSIADALKAAGARFYVWGPMRDKPVVRLVCSFATSESDVNAFLAACRRAVEVKA
ncbi:MAG: low specificity L-threonine aldolase [Alphaproteobacteria bacterium]|nr:low specificity L-threonine aldolase [Alphaproteobacteria bacterium]